MTRTRSASSSAVGSGAGAHLMAKHGGRIAVAAGTLVAAVDLAIQAGYVDGTAYWPTGVGLLLFGLGAGIAMPSAIDLIMSTLPPARAGVGSAVNDTVREIGGALGVAIIGSVAATTYTSTLHADLTQVPGLTGALRAAVTDNIGAALGVSHRLGAGGDSIATFARDAFVGSMRGALWIAVGMAVVATIVAIVTLPDGAAAEHGSALHASEHERESAVVLPSNTQPESAPR